MDVGFNNVLTDRIIREMKRSTMMVFQLSCPYLPFKLILNKEH